MESHEAGDRLQLDAWILVAQTLHEERNRQVRQLAPVVGQRPQRQCTHRGIGGCANEHGVRPRSSELLQREHRGDARVVRPLTVERQLLQS